MFYVFRLFNDVIMHTYIQGVCKYRNNIFTFAPHYITSLLIKHCLHTNEENKRKLNNASKDYKQLMNT